MVLMNGKDVTQIYNVLDGETIGTYFKENPEENFELSDYM